MKTLLSTLCAAVLCLSPVVAGPASAASVTPAVLTTGAGSQAPVLEQLVQVQQRHRYQNNRRGANRWGDSRHRFDNRGRRPHQPPPRRHHHRGGSSGPDLGSAIVGAIVGGVIVNQLNSGRQPHYAPPATTYLSRAHIDWCHNRWRSYRVSDNSYQPYNGPRRICSSPYGP